MIQKLPALSTWRGSAVTLEKSSCAKLWTQPSVPVRLNFRSTSMPAVGRETSSGSTTSTTPRQKNQNPDYTGSFCQRSIQAAWNCPPDDRLVNQLIGLERRTARGRLDSIDHAPGGHDDRSNVVAGLVSTKAASNYDIELFINGHRAGDEKLKHTTTSRRPVIEALRQAGIPLN